MGKNRDAGTVVPPFTQARAMETAARGELLAAVLRDASLSGKGMPPESLTLIGGPFCRKQEDAATVALWLWQAAELLGFSEPLKWAAHAEQTRQWKDERSHRVRSMIVIARRFVETAEAAVTSGVWNVKGKFAPPLSTGLRLSNALENKGEGYEWEPPEPYKMSGAIGLDLARLIDLAGLSERMATLWALHISEKEAPKPTAQQIAVMADTVKRDANAIEADETTRVSELETDGGEKTAEQIAPVETGEDTAPAPLSDEDKASAAFLDEMDVTPLHR